MNTTYRLRADEINDKILESIRLVYGNREIAVTIEDVGDETEYLLGSPANRERLLESVGAIDRGDPLRTFSPEEFDAFVERHLCFTAAQAEALGGDVW